ncbi:hypothetical protein K1T71_009182 [Dendrolimus kikuchii]|uniref:Uncharacterized protein n=1 Tax=Dendrolimus kikuchii TaxID=765133 RepID=A0ACC1CU19_9NEOP|nr:hypothetical protein K1T71_009182 [Dendrolimus kikuchii]
MRRSNKFRKINRNNDTDFFDHINSMPSRLSTVTPNIFVGELYIDEPDSYNNGVQIIELNSTTSSVSSAEESLEYNGSQAWSYASDDAFKELEETFRINKKARERRRLINQSQFNNINSPESDEENINDFFIGSTLDQTFSDDVIINHETNCFTIINKRILVSETSSEDDRTDGENLKTSEFAKQIDWCDNKYTEETTAYTDTDDIEKRTVWIYSFKNKNLLTEDAFEFVNISVKDTGSSSCTEDVEEPIVDANRCRVGSPIPPVYIPKLNLCPTLSTVTEITESAKPISSNDTESSVDEVPKQNPNNWFADENQSARRNSYNHEKSTNINNWMTLSHRERRRICLSTNSDVFIEKKDKTLQKAGFSAKSNSSVVSRRDSEVTNVRDSQVHNVSRILDVSSILSPKSVENNSTIINIDDDKIHSGTFEETIGKGDIKYKESDRMKNRPSININPQVVDKKNITEPIENLESNNWIFAENVEKQTAAFNYELDQVIPFSNNDDMTFRTSSASDRLWARNMSLLKPAKWTEFLPITETVPSLTLSLSSTSYVEKSWARRFIQIFRCCK